MKELKHEGMKKLQHIIPSNCLRDHVTEKECWCKPEFDGVFNNIVIHNAFNEREKGEGNER